jgi:hypothetical protein
MRLELTQLLERAREVSVKADGAVVDVGEGGGLLVGDHPDVLGEAPFGEPAFDVRTPADSEDDHAVAFAIELLEELARARTRRVEEVGAFPAVERVQDAVEVYANERLVVVVPGSVRRRDS